MPIKLPRICRKLVSLALLQTNLIGQTFILKMKKADPKRDRPNRFYNAKYSY